MDRLATPYGYDPDTLDLAAWRMGAEVKAEIEGKEGCAAISQSNRVAYVPIYFGDGARCEVVRKDGITVVYGVGYGDAYEGLNHLRAGIYIFRDDGFIILEDLPNVPDLQTFTSEQEQALREFDRMHQADFAGPSWKAYSDLNRSYLRKELDVPSPRVTEAMAALQARVEALRF